MTATAQGAGLPSDDTRMFGENTTNQNIRVLDTKCLSRIESFSGKEADWEEWKFSAVAFLHNLGLGPALKELNERTDAPNLLEMVRD